MSSSTGDMARCCRRCDFEIWTPIVGLTASVVGLYDDARYPGRLIVSANEHYDHLEMVPSSVFTPFMADVQVAARALRQWDEGILRVNVAVLGNSVPHVHAHLIPRRPGEPNQRNAPWDCAAPLRTLVADRVSTIVRELRSVLQDIPTAGVRLSLGGADDG